MNGWYKLSQMIQLIFRPTHKLKTGMTQKHICSCSSTLNFTKTKMEWKPGWKQWVSAFISTILLFEDIDHKVSQM